MKSKNKKTLLSDVKNFGPVTLPEMNSLGKKYVEDLKLMGFEHVCRKWVEYYPERLNANAFLGVLATIEGLVWTKATPNMRAQARNLVKLLKNEFNS